MKGSGLALTRKRSVEQSTALQEVIILERLQSKRKEHKKTVTGLRVASKRGQVLCRNRLPLNCQYH